MTIARLVEIEKTHPGSIVVGVSPAALRHLLVAELSARQLVPADTQPGQLGIEWNSGHGGYYVFVWPRSNPKKGVEP